MAKRIRINQTKCYGIALQVSLLWRKKKPRSYRPALSEMPPFAKLVRQKPGPALMSGSIRMI